MKRIIIVDDHAIVRRGIRETLEDMFGEAECADASSAEQALDLAGKGRWDLMLLDIGLGDSKRSGLDVLEQMRQLHPKVPVLIQSQYPEEEYGLRVLKMGAAGYVNKEAGSDELIAAVQRAISGGKYISPALAERVADGFHLTESPKHERLSPRELQLLILIAQGKSQKEIAQIWNLSIKTIGTYHRRLLDKMKTKNDVELTRSAIFNKLVG